MANLGELSSSGIELDRWIGQGAEGWVALGHNAKRRQRLAIKFLSRQLDSPRSLESLLDRAAFSHPNLAKVVDYGSTDPRELESLLPFPRGGDEWSPGDSLIYVVTEFREGLDLEEYLQRLTRRGSAESLDLSLRAILTDALSALLYLHDLGFIHYDVKPAHLIISGSSDERPECCVIDLGLMDRGTTPLGNRVRGTPPFIAPEIYSSSLVDERVDLYSLGASLYQALTGGVITKNYSGSKLLEVVRENHWPRLSDLAPEVGVDLSTLIHQLLEPDPERRIGSAAEALQQLGTSGLDSQDPPKPIPGQVPRLVGHEREYDYVVREIEKLPVDEMNHRLIVLSGEHGSGRQAIVNRLLDLAQLRGIRRFWVRCSRSSRWPWTPLVELIRGLSELPDLGPDLQAQYSQAAAQLEGSVDFDWEPLFDRSSERYRFLDWIGSLFSELPEELPFLFVFEELDSAWPELPEALRVICRSLEGASKELNENPEARPTTRRRVLFLATTEKELRDEVRPAIQNLSSDPYASHIDLRPLSFSRTRELVERALGPCDFSLEFLSELHNLTEGRPQELLGILSRSQRHGLIERRGAWVCPEGQLDPNSLARLETEDWEALEPESQLLLATLIGAGGLLPGKVLNRLCGALGDNSEQLLERLRRLESEGILHYDLRSDQWRTTRDMVSTGQLDLKPIQIAEAAQPPNEDAAHWSKLFRLFAERTTLIQIKSLRERPESPDDATTSVRISAEAIQYEAESLFALGRYEAALKRFRELTSALPAGELKLNQQLQSIRTLRRLGRFEAALAELDQFFPLEESTATTLDFRAALERAKVLNALGQHSECAELCARVEASISSQPRHEFDLEAQEVRCRLVIEFGQAKQSLNLPSKALRELKRTQSTDLPPSLQALILEARGRLEFTCGNYHEARDVLIEALE